ncbi:glycoside hydrolase family 43 protein [Natronospora cellulosivora (SeqCode)]
MNNYQKDYQRKEFKNPIMPGFYPDPSMCRVGDDYYLVTSSFAYFPGVPIFHSKDLVNWRQIGHVLDRPSQLELENHEQSQGIFAPTIRYHNGTFYMITTNIRKGNFIVTSKDPAGSWSDPYWLDDAPGIDPSLFFDDDGKVYYCGNRNNPEGYRYNGDCEIYLQELDLEEMKLVGDKHSLWRGALKTAIWPEGPHIYKKDGYYYLLIAEGGTGPDHAVTIARSKNITGPYQGFPKNPILTHRHLGNNDPIVNVGHGDFVKTQNDEWWMVVLASRPYGGYYRNLGRETFLVPLIWEDGWPVVCPGEGKISERIPYPDLPITPWPKESLCDNFDSDKLSEKWLYIRNTNFDNYDLESRPGHLRLKLAEDKLSEKNKPVFVAKRQQDMSFLISTSMEFSPEENEEAGIVLHQNHEYHYRFVLSQENNERVIKLIKCSSGKEELIAKAKYAEEKIYLKVEADGQDLTFYYSSDSVDYKVLEKNVDARILSTDVAGGFVGTCLGLYASSNGSETKNFADFDYFEYRGLDD